MTVRVPVFRPGTPLIVLLLAVLLHTALGPILGCHADPPRTAVVPVAAASSSAPAECVGCSPDQQYSVVLDACTADRPCQDGTAGRHDPLDTVARWTSAPSDDGPAVSAMCDAPPPPQPRVALDPAAVPEPLAAVLAPVAVLCVDRN